MIEDRNRCQWLARCTNKSVQTVQTAVGPFRICSTCLQAEERKAGRS